MKQTILTLGFLFSVLTSCTEPTKEEVLKDVFMEYVQTDFGDPNEFKEITSIEPVDTLTNNVLLSVLENFENVHFLLKEREKEKLEEFREKAQTDKNCIITYEVKARIGRYGRKSVKTYYIIDDGLDYKVQDHKLFVDEAPELYKSILEYAEAVYKNVLSRAVDDAINKQKQDIFYIE